MDAVNEQINIEPEVSKEDLEIVIGHKFDIETDEGIVISAKQVVFYNNTKSVAIVYRDLNEYETPIDLKFLAQVVVTDESGQRYLLGLTFDSDGSVLIETLSSEYPDLQVPQEPETLPIDPDYSPRDTGDLEALNDEGEVTPQKWWTKDGCLPGGYQHCGGNCGYGLGHGGGKPINQTDSCCVIHDRCYKSSTRNCKCDKAIVTCVKHHKTTASVGIRVLFGTTDFC